MEHHLTVSVVPKSLFVFPGANKTIVFQVELVIVNPGAFDIIPLKTEINVHSSLNWFSSSLHNFKITCEASFCILREATLRETFYFILQQDVGGLEQNAFYEIINEAKDAETIKFIDISFSPSDGAVISVPVDSKILPPDNSAYRLN